MGLEGLEKGQKAKFGRLGRGSGKGQKAVAWRGSGKKLGAWEKAKSQIWWLGGGLEQAKKPSLVAKGEKTKFGGLEGSKKTKFGCLEGPKSQIWGLGGGLEKAKKPNLVAKALSLMP